MTIITKKQYILPKYVKFADEKEYRPNCSFELTGEKTYTKHYGGWDIKVKVVKNKIICNPDYPQVMHLKGIELIECSKEDIKKEQENGYISKNYE